MMTDFKGVYQKNAWKKEQEGDLLLEENNDLDSFKTAKVCYETAIDLYGEAEDNGKVRYLEKRIEDIDDAIKEYMDRKKDNKPIHSNNNETEDEKFDISPNKTKSDIYFSDVMGVDDIVYDLQTEINFGWDEDNNLKDERSKGIIFYGPPGSGKTLLAKALSNEYDVPFYAIKSGEVLHKWLGESEQYIRDLFAAARSDGKAIIYIDEIEELLRKRDENEHGAIRRVTNALLAELDGFDSDCDQHVVIGSTNNIDVIDPAMIRGGRFDVRYEFPIPDKKSMVKLLDRKLETYKNNCSDEIDSEKIITSLDDYNVKMSDIAKTIFGKAARYAWRRSKEEGVETQLKMEDFLNAVFYYKTEFWQNRKSDKNGKNDDDDCNKAYI